MTIKTGDAVQWLGDRPRTGVVNRIEPGNMQAALLVQWDDDPRARG